MSVKVYATYAKTPTSTEPGILGVKVVADPVVSTRSIHIALVLDTSGSMEGDRINSVKNTLNVLIDKVNIGDRITIVGFSSRANKIASNVVISDELVRTSLKTEVAKLTADGGTNMEAGISMLGSLFTAGGSDHPDSLVLLTDGFVNEGITSLAGIHSLLNSYLPNLPVCSLGYGDDHNSEFMRGLSTRTSGVYNFIDNEIALPASIGELLGALQCEAAKAAVLTFPAGSKCLELGAKTDTTEHGLGSLIGEKPTWAMFSVPEAAAAAAAGAFVLKYKPFGSADYTSMNVIIDEAAIDRIDVVEQHLRCITATALDKAGTQLKTYHIEDAKRIVTEATDVISASEAKDRPMAIRMKAQLDEMAEEIKGILNGPARRVDFVNLAMRSSGTATRYTQQRGVSSSGGGHHDDPFSTPSLMRRQNAMVAGYSQSVGGNEDPHDNEDIT